MRWRAKSNHLRQVGIALAFLAALIALPGCRSYEKRTIRTHVNAAFLAQGLSHAGSVKMAVIMYFQEFGEMPASNSELGIPAPAEFNAKGLRSIEVTGGGRLILTYSGESGVHGGRIYLTPNLANPMLTSWSCTTPSYPGIEKLIPQCEFRK